MEGAFLYHAYNSRNYSVRKRLDLAYGVENCLKITIGKGFVSEEAGPDVFQP